MQLPESPMELPEPKLISSNIEHNEHSPYSEIVEPLKQEISILKMQLEETQCKLQQFLSQANIRQSVEDIVATTLECKNLESPESHIEIDCEHKILSNTEKADVKYSSIVPIHKTNVKSGSSQPVTKMAERIKLKRATDGQRDVNPSELVNSDLSTAVAEHMVGDILRQCDVQSEKQAMEVELRRLNAKLENARSQNTVLALTLTETKAHCDRFVSLYDKL